MKILQLQTKITKWEQSSNNYIGKLLDGEDPTFSLSPHHTEHKTLFIAAANIYITNPKTDFILDINIESSVKMDITSDLPTVNELYEAYLSAHNEWSVEILKKSMNHAIVIDRKRPPISLNEIKDLLQSLINNTYRLN